MNSILLTLLVFSSFDPLFLFLSYFLFHIRWFLSVMFFIIHCNLDSFSVSPVLQRKRLEPASLPENQNRFQKTVQQNHRGFIWFWNHSNTEITHKCWKTSFSKHNYSFDRSCFCQPLTLWCDFSRHFRKTHIYSSCMNPFCISILLLVLFIFLSCSSYIHCNLELHCSSFLVSPVVLQRRRKLHPASLPINAKRIQRTVQNRGYDSEIIHKCCKTSFSWEVQW